MHKPCHVLTSLAYLTLILALCNRRYTQPFVFSLANQGYYNIEFTGDIASFNEDFLEFSLLSLGVDAPLYSDQFAVMVQFRFVKAVNVAFYYNGRQVTQNEMFVLSSR